MAKVWYDGIRSQGRDRERGVLAVMGMALEGVVVVMAVVVVEDEEDVRVAGSSIGHPRRYARSVPPASMVENRGMGCGPSCLRAVQKMDI